MTGPFLDDTLVPRTPTAPDGEAPPNGGSTMLVAALVAAAIVAAALLGF